MEGGHSRTNWWTVVVIVGLGLLFGGGQVARAHQFTVQNQLNDSVLVECHSGSRSNGEHQLMAGKRYVFAWFDKPTRTEDWVCGFSWLGTTNVKQFWVWNHTFAWGPMVCDSCEWTVQPSGFFLQGDTAAQTGYQFMFGWDTSCLTSSSTPASLPI